MSAVDSVIFEALGDQRLNLSRQLLIGASDYSEYVLKWPAITQTADGLRPTVINLNLSNDGGTFNFFREDPTTLVTSCEINLGVEVNSQTYDENLVRHSQWQLQKHGYSAIGHGTYNYGRVPVPKELDHANALGGAYQFHKTDDSDFFLRSLRVRTTSEGIMSYINSLGETEFNMGVYVRNVNSTWVYLALGANVTSFSNVGSAHDYMSIFNILSGTLVSEGAQVASSAATIHDFSVSAVNSFRHYRIGINSCEIDDMFIAFSTTSDEFRSSITDSGAAANISGWHIGRGSVLMGYVPTQGVPVHRGNTVTSNNTASSILQYNVLPAPCFVDSQMHWDIPARFTAVNNELYVPAADRKEGAVILATSEYTDSSLLELGYQGGVISNSYFDVSSGQDVTLRVMVKYLPNTLGAGSSFGYIGLDNGRSVPLAVFDITRADAASGTQWTAITSGTFGYEISSRNAVWKFGAQGGSYDARMTHLGNGWMECTLDGPMGSTLDVIVYPMVSSSGISAPGGFPRGARIGLTSMQCYSGTRASGQYFHQTHHRFFPDPTTTMYATLYRGKSSGARYARTTARVTITDKIKRLSEQRVGDTETPVTYVSSNYLPGDIAWWLCTSYGGFDLTADSSNPDIDYPSWEEWSGVFSDASIFVNANFNGTPITTALRKLARMTGSAIYMREDKIHFRRFSNASSVTIELDGDNTFTDAVLSIDDNDVINRQVVYADYDTDASSFAVVVDEQDNASVNSYGLREDIEKDLSVWHINSATADDLAQRRITEFGIPYETVEVDVPLRGMYRRIGDMMVVEEPSLSLSDSYRIMRTQIDLENGAVTFTGRSNQVFNAFILDQSSLGGSDVLV